MLMHWLVLVLYLFEYPIDILEKYSWQPDTANQYKRNKWTLNNYTWECATSLMKVDKYTL